MKVMFQLKKPNFSKLLCIFSTILLIVLLYLAIKASSKGEDLTFYLVAVPMSFTLVCTTYSFYFNKAKMENLSKQQIRTLLIRLALEKYISKDEFDILCKEVEEIDSAVEQKLQEAFSDAVNKDIKQEDV